MSLSFDGMDIKKICYARTNLTKLMYNGTEIWTNQITVTYIYGGVSTEVLYNKGEVITDYVPTDVSGRTFVGWTTSSTGTTAETITAGESNVTLLGIGRTTLTSAVRGAGGVSESCSVTAPSGSLGFISAYATAYTETRYDGTISSATISLTGAQSRSSTSDIAVSVSTSATYNPPVTVVAATGSASSPSDDFVYTRNVDLSAVLIYVG